MTAILGMNCYKHDSAASLLVDGKLVGAAEEERFRRVKHYPGYPEKTVDYLLKEASLDPSDLDHIAFYMKPGLVMRENLAHSRYYLLGKQGLYFLLSQLNGARRMKNIGDTVRDHLGDSCRAEVSFVDHHKAHALAAVYCSGFEEAAVLTMDGVGERDTSMLGEMKNGALRVFSTSRVPHSPGMYYSAVTRYLGFMPDNDEYKVMGLSSYGKPEFLSLFRRIITARSGKILVDRGLLNLHMGVHHSSFSPEVISVIGPPRKPGEPIEPVHENIACSAQKALEEVGLALAGHLREKSSSRKLVISGGVGLNCVMNGLLERESGFEDIYPMPASHDAGTSLGAALWAHSSYCPGIPAVAPDHMYLGPSYSEDEILEVLKVAGLSWSRPDDLEDRIAGLIEEGRIVALFTGRMEFGPRALGNRSILADPRREEMKDILNSMVKHREPFRPFCPSCLVEKAPEYFLGCTEAPYMIKTYPVIPHRQKEIPSVTHVDGTARVQTVSRDTNPFYYGIISAFHRRTGVPIVLNTSFNVRGEPIVNTPVDAVRCFYGTGIDVLAMPPFLLEKPAIENEGNRTNPVPEGT